MENDGIQTGTIDQAGNLCLRLGIMTMDNEHVFRKLGWNDGGHLGCRWVVKIGEFFLKRLDCSVEKCDRKLFALYKASDGFWQRGRSVKP